METEMKNSTLKFVSQMVNINMIQKNVEMK